MGRADCGNIGSERLEFPAQHQRLHRLDRGDADLVAAADGKDQSMPFVPLGTIGMEDQIGGGIVRILVHRIGTGKAA